jgi:hypothetical protein
MTTAAEEMYRLQRWYTQLYDHFWEQNTAGVIVGTDPERIARYRSMTAEGVRWHMLNKYKPITAPIKGRWVNSPWNIVLNIAANSSIPPAETERIFARKDKLMKIAFLAPWPIIDDQKWYWRCARAAKLSCGFSLMDTRMYTDKFNGTFWYENAGNDQLDWEAYFSLEYSNLIDSLTGCVQHKAEKHMRGEVRDARWSGIASGALSLVLPGPLTWATNLMEKPPQQFQAELMSTITQLGQIPDMLVPLYKYWIEKIKAWKDRRAAREASIATTEDRWVPVPQLVDQAQPAPAGKGPSGKTVLAVSAMILPFLFIK